MRYTVREVHGMCLGAGAFVVNDGNTGRTVGEYFYFRDDAEKLARRLNALEATT